MRMIKVDSKNLVAVGYDPANKTLHVQFHKGQGIYFDVPQTVFDALMSTSFKGEYHAKHIRNVCRYERINPR